MAEIISFRKPFRADDMAALLYQFEKKLRDIEIEKIALLHYIDSVQEHGLEMLVRYREEGAFTDEIKSNIDKCSLTKIVRDYLGIPFDSSKA